MSKKSYVIDVSKLDSLSEITVDDILEPHVLVFYGNFIGLFTKAHKSKNGYNANLEDTESCHANNLLSALVSRLVDIDKKTLFFGTQEVLTYWRSLFVEIFGIVPENLTPIENAKERKDVKVWWVNGYKDNIRLAVKTDDNINIKEIVADNIRFMYPAVRPKKLKPAEVQTFYDNEAKSITKFVKYAWGKNVKINKIIGNPPYNVGSQIIHAIIEHCMDKDTDASIIGPLSMYKSNGNYRHVEDFRLANPEMFENVSITNNLCICKLRKDVVDRFKTYEEMSMESYGSNILPYIKACDTGKKDFKCSFMTTPSSHDDYSNDYTFAISQRVAKDGIPNSSSTWGYKYNVLKSIQEIPVHHRKDEKGSLYTAFICNWGKGGEKRKENFTTFAYKGRLLNFVILQMNKTSGTIEPAIPRIDWEAISGTQLWKEGKYDEAVLDVMGLKWNDDKSGVVRK